MLLHKKRKIGYALGGGLACGLFHIGVLNVLEENHIYPDIIVGTSMGAVIGALYASGLSVSDIKQMVIELDWKRMVSLTDISLIFNGLLQGKRVTSFLKSILKDRTFAQMKRKFACVATDVMTGDQVVLQEGSLIESIRASISLPAIFTPVKINGRHLIDGGLVNVVPVSVCRDLGADFVFGINVIARPRENFSIQDTFENYYDYQLRHIGSKQEIVSSDELKSVNRSHIRNIKNAIKKFFLQGLTDRRRRMLTSWNTIVDGKPVALLYKNPNLSYLLSQTLSIIEYRIAIENLKEADLAITPFNGNIGFMQFNRVLEAINAGEIAARLTLQRNDIARSMLDRQLSIAS